MRLTYLTLQLHKIQREKRIGYASILYIECECGLVWPVATGKCHRPQDKPTTVGMPVYDINTKATLGIKYKHFCFMIFHSLLKYLKQ